MRAVYGFAAGGGADLDAAMRVQEWLFRSDIGSEHDHRRIDAPQAQLAAARRK